MDSYDATGKVTIGTPNDKGVDCHHQSMGSQTVQTKNIPKIKHPKKQHPNMCELQKDGGSAGTELDQTQGSDSRGMSDLQGGANRKITKQSSKQNKKSTLKEEEQKEQLKLDA